MNFGDQVHGMQGVDFTRAGGTTTLIHTPDRTFLTKDDSTASEGIFVLGMPNQNAGNISDGITKLHHQPPVQLITITTGYRVWI